MRVMYYARTGEEYTEDDPKQSEQSLMAYAAAEQQPPPKPIAYSATPVAQQPTYTTVGSIPAILHCSLLVVLTAIVAVFYNRDSPSDGWLRHRDGWSLTPTPCSLDFTKGCMATADNFHYNASLGVNQISRPDSSWNCSTPNTCHLEGVSPEYERPSSGLFSAMGIPFLCLGMQVVNAVFALQYVHLATDSGEARLLKGMKRFTMLILLAYAIFFMFIQNTWDVPMNNLLVVEVILMLALSHVALQKSHAYVDGERDLCAPAHLVEAMLTMPLLTVASLAALGTETSTELIQPFFALVFSYLLEIGVEFERQGLDHRGRMGTPDDISALRVMNLNCGLVAIPFICQMGLAFASAAAADAYGWAIAAAAVVLATVPLFHLVVTLYLIRTHIRDFVFVRLSPTGTVPEAQRKESYAKHIRCLQYLALLGKSAAVLTLMIGALSVSS